MSDGFTLIDSSRGVGEIAEERLGCSLMGTISRKAAKLAKE